MELTLEKNTTRLRWHLKYAAYLIRHKYYVLVECVRLGVPFLGLVHDLSKFTPSEWFPYVESFSKNSIYKDLLNTSVRSFDYAWNFHQKRNKHHPEFWVLGKGRYRKCLPIPDRYRREMLADWVGANRAKNNGKNKILSWYAKNKSILELHSETRNWIESELAKNYGETCG